MTGNNKIRVIYDPYQQEIRCEYMSAAGNTWEAPQAGGKLAAMFPKGKRQGSLQNCVHDIVCGIEKDFCTTGQGVDLFFCGTEEDWVDLKKVVEREESSKITCVGSAGQLECAKDVLPKIKEIFQHLSNDFEGLTENDEVKKPIDQFLTTIKPDVVLYVSGTYSAGKSTFINALIGEELLPSAIDPTTAHIFKIEALPEGDWTDIKVHFKYREQETGLSFNQDGYALENLNQLPDQELKAELDKRLAEVERGPRYVHEALSVLNGFDNTLAEQGTEEAPPSSISAEIEVSTPFFKSTLPIKDYHFLIYDTPGTNAANHRDHLAVMQESLKEQTNGLPILLVTPTQTDATEVEKLRNEIHELGGALDESNILVVVTQADKEEISDLEKIAQRSEQVAAFKNAGNRIFYVSSIVGLGAKLDDVQQWGKFKTFKKAKEDYTDGSTMLYQIDSLPQNQLDLIRDAGAKVNENGTVQEKLLHNSGLWAIEQEIERFARRFAGYNKCWQAKRYLSEAIEATKVSADKEHTIQTEIKERDIKQFDEQKEKLVKRVNEESADWEKGAFNRYREEQRKIITCFSPDESELIPIIKNKWKSEKESKGKKDAVKLLIDWANEYVNEHINQGKDAIAEYTIDFWRDNVEKLKKTCLSIVRDSTGLPKEDRDIIEKYILEIQEPEFWSKQSVLSKKDFQQRFLFIPYIGMEAKEIAEKIRKRTIGTLRYYGYSYLDNLNKDIENWIASFLDGMAKNMDTLSPTLKKLNNRIRECTKRIESLEQAQERLIGAKRDLEGYFLPKDQDGGSL